MLSSKSSKQIVHPEADFATYMKCYEKALTTFLDGNKPIDLLKANQLKIKDYHGILLSIFHQVYMGATSLALAGSMVDSKMFEVREYLFHHAEEEMTHWKWILDDLEATEYKGKDPRTLFPKTSTQAYLSYAMFLANKFPLGRLAMAMVLEGISGKFGSLYGMDLVKNLNLKKNQVTFFLSHGELDQGHTEDIAQVMKELPISGNDWAYLCHVTHCTANLYKGIYNSFGEDLFDIENI